MLAVVRLLAHRTADPVDFCELHWPGVAASLAVRGIALVDTTGDLSTVKDHFPDWSVWTSSSGMIYATTVLASGAGTTVHAFLAGQVCAQIATLEAMSHA